MSWGGCGVRIVIAADVLRRVDYYGFASLILGSASDSALVFRVGRCLAGIDWSSIGKFPYRFHLSF